MLGLDWSSLYTFSGLLFIGAALMYVLERQLFAAVLLIIAGAEAPLASSFYALTLLHARLAARPSRPAS